MAFDLSSLDRRVADFASVAADYDRRAEFPVDHVDRLREAGILALAAPRDLGGGGADLSTALSVIQSIALGGAGRQSFGAVKAPN